MLFLLNSCSRKTNPGESTSRSVYGTDNNNAINSTTASTKPVAAKKNKTAVPKVIVVNDNVASKTFDGRYYYDLEGHRYWRNNKDGKYYLYNKSMANDPAFKKP
jgi:phage-related protein